MLNSKSQNPLMVCKEMSSGSYTNNISYKLFTYKSYMFKQDLTLNNPGRLICHKTTKQTKLANK